MSSIRIGVPRILMRPFGDEQSILMEVSPTTGGIHFKRNVQRVTVSPNNSADFEVATARPVGIAFSMILTTSNQWLFEQGLGEYEVQVVMPPDARGNEDVWHFPRMRMTKSHYEFSMTKNAVPTIDFELESTGEMLVIAADSLRDSGERFNNSIMAIAQLLDTDMTPQELAADECWDLAGSDESCLS